MIATPAWLTWNTFVWSTEFLSVQYKLITNMPWWNPAPEKQLQWRWTRLQGQKFVEHSVAGGRHHDHIMRIREQNCHVNSLPACIVTPIIHRITWAITWARSTSYQVRQNSLLLQINWSSRSTIARYPCNLDVDCCASALHVWVTRTLELTRLWVRCVLSWSDECASSCGMGGDRCIHVHLCWMKIGSLRCQANSRLVNMSWISKPTSTLLEMGCSIRTWR